MNGMDGVTSCFFHRKKGTRVHVVELVDGIRCLTCAAVVGKGGHVQRWLSIHISRTNHLRSDTAPRTEIDVSIHQDLRVRKGKPIHNHHLLLMCRCIYLLF